MPGNARHRRNRADDFIHQDESLRPDASLAPTEHRREEASPSLDIRDPSDLTAEFDTASQNEAVRHLAYLKVEIPTKVLLLRKAWNEASFRLDGVDEPKSEPSA